MVHIKALAVSALCSTVLAQRPEPLSDANGTTSSASVNTPNYILIRPPGTPSYHPKRTSTSWDQSYSHGTSAVYVSSSSSQANTYPTAVSTNKNIGSYYTHTHHTRTHKTRTDKTRTCKTRTYKKHTSTSGNVDAYATTSAAYPTASASDSSTSVPYARSSLSAANIYPSPHAPHNPRTRTYETRAPISQIVTSWVPVATCTRKFLPASAAGRIPNPDFECYAREGMPCHEERTPRLIPRPTDLSSNAVVECTAGYDILGNGVTYRHGGGCQTITPSSAAYPTPSTSHSSTKKHGPTSVHHGNPSYQTSTSAVHYTKPSPHTTISYHPLRTTIPARHTSSWFADHGV